MIRGKFQKSGRKSDQKMSSGGNKKKEDALFSELSLVLKDKETSNELNQNESPVRLSKQSDKERIN